jgi:hypothetical protein
MSLIKRREPKAFLTGSLAIGRLDPEKQPTPFREAGMPRLRPFALAPLAALPASCAAVTSYAAAPPPAEVFATLSGLWNWADRDCDDDPFTLQPAEDGGTITLTFSEPDSTGTARVSAYRVLGHGAGFARGQITDEDRRTPTGELVAWDFVLLSPDAFCWHRTDWRAGACTQPVRRCRAQPASPASRAS